RVGCESVGNSWGELPVCCFLSASLKKMQKLLQRISLDHDDPHGYGIDHLELDLYGNSAMFGDSQGTQRTGKSASVDEQSVFPGRNALDPPPAALLRHP